MYIHIIASRKLRLQICSAVYCLSWLFFFFYFFFFLLLLLFFSLLFSFNIRSLSPISLLPYISFLHSLYIYSLFIPSRVFSLCPCIFYPPCTTFLLLNSSFFFFFFFRLSKKFSSSSFNVSLRVKRINSSTRSSSIRDFGEEFYSHW